LFRSIPLALQFSVIMHTTQSLVLSLFVLQTSGHGVVTMIKGANGVDMPGLSGIFSSDLF